MFNPLEVISESNLYLNKHTGALVRFSYLTMLDGVLNAQGEIVPGVYPKPGVRYKDITVKVNETFEDTHHLLTESQKSTLSDFFRARDWCREFVLWYMNTIGTQSAQSEAIDFVGIHSENWRDMVCNINGRSTYICPRTGDSEPVRGDPVDIINAIEIADRLAAIQQEYLGFMPTKERPAVLDPSISFIRALPIYTLSIKTQ